MLEDYIQAEKKRVNVLAVSIKALEDNIEEKELMSGNLEKELAAQQQAIRLAYDVKYKSGQKLINAFLEVFKSEYEKVIKISKWKWGDFLKKNRHLDNEELLKQIKKKVNTIQKVAQA